MRSIFPFFRLSILREIFSQEEYTQSKLVFGLNQGVTCLFALGDQPQTNLGSAYARTTLVFGNRKSEAQSAYKGYGSEKSKFWYMAISEWFVIGLSKQIQGVGLRN